MANPTDDFADTQSQNGEQAHTQETGDDGLSNKMPHNFSESYNGNALSVEEKGCCVRPIPKEEAVTSEFPEMAEKVPHPSVFGSESQSVPAAEKGVVQLGGLAVVNDNNLPPQSPLNGQSDNRKEEEAAVKALPGRKATEADLKEAGGESCNMGPKMDTGKNPAKRAPGVPKGGRKRKRCEKRAAGNNWKLSYLHCVGLLLAHVGVCKGSPVPTKPPGDRNIACFTCNGYDDCKTLKAIFDSNVTLLYERSTDDPIETCLDIPPAPKTAFPCTVCQDRSTVFIGCTSNIAKIEAEKNGSPLNITNGCKPLPPTGLETNEVVSDNSPSHERFGLIPVVVEALVVFLICCG